jgi:hypothetical protein
MNDYNGQQIIMEEISGIDRKDEQDSGSIEHSNSDRSVSISDKAQIRKDKYTNKEANIISKGNLLEYRLKRLIFSMGYYPKVGVIIKTSQDEQADMITDLDVYGFYIHKNFVSKAIWVDCKSGQAKPLERISWIIGVKNTVQIDDVIFVKKGIRPATKQFARKSGIQILDLEIIERLERDFAIESNDWRGSWNPQTQIGQLVTFQRINIPNGEAFKKIGNYISSSYWTLDNYTRIKKTITALKQLSEIVQFPLQVEQIKSVHWAIFELINLFILATLNISKELYYFSDKDKRETMLDSLISGEISSKKRAELVEATYKIAYSIIQKQIPEFKGKVEIPSLGMNPPRYFEAYYDLVLRITNKPLDYYDVLRFLDFVFMEYDLQNKKIDEATLKNIFPNYSNLVTSAKTIIHFICNITGIPKDIFTLIK